MLTKNKNRLPPRSANRALASAARIATAMEMREPDVRKRMLTVLVVLGIAILGCIGSLSALALGWPGSEPARLFTVFVLLGSAGLALLAALGLGVISWNAYVRQRILTEEARFEVWEATEQMEALLGALSSEIVAESHRRDIVRQLRSRSVLDLSEVVGETLQLCKRLVEDLEKRLLSKDDQLSGISGPASEGR